MKIMDKLYNMNPKARSILIISSLIVIGIIIGFIIASVSSPYLINQIENPPNHFFPKNGDFNGTKQLERFNLTTDQTNQIIRGYTTSVIILSVELVLLIGLIAIYTNIYSKTKSKYLIGFLLFVGIFLVKSISQLVAMTPLFRDVIREAPTAINPLFRSNFGPFGIFFTIFEIIAICILIYISSE